jgi:gluconolactonase
MRLDDLIDPAAELTRVGEGYQFTEGPVWDAQAGCLYFSDIPGDARWRWTPDAGMELVQRPTFMGNGMCLDNDGHLLVCEHISSCVTRQLRDGGHELVAYHYEGKYLNSPNDIVVRGSDGSMYFTDPPGGSQNDWIGQKRGPALTVGFAGLFRVPPGGGELERLAADEPFLMPNGLCFSPDESILYVNDTARQHVLAFDVAADGSLSGRRVLIDHVGEEDWRKGGVDGMECDEHGNVWVTGPGGVWVVSPAGEHLGVVAAPELTASLGWGGEDLHSLFLMTSTTVHVVRTLVGPAPLPPR